jgi:glutathionyl-hydroquinone reductase
MLRLVKLKKRTFYIMIISAAAVILSVSVDTLLRANNDLLFNEWITGGSFEINDSEQLYRLYLSSLMADYFFRMIVPVAFGLQTYFAFISPG